MVYQVVSVRKSGVTNFTEGSFAVESVALDALIALGSDADCLIAEIQEWSTSGLALKPIPILAQYERRDGSWIQVLGELRCRTRGGEAEEILAAASAA